MHIVSVRTFDQNLVILLNSCKYNKIIDFSTVISILLWFGLVSFAFPQSEFLFTLQGSIFILLLGIISKIQCYKIDIKKLSSRGINEQDKIYKLKNLYFFLNTARIIYFQQ